MITIDALKVKYEFMAENFEGWQACLWTSKQDQFDNFELIKKHLILPCSILEVGCSYGDFKNHINDENLNYEGIDISHKMLETAKTNHKNVTFHEGKFLDYNFTKSYDYVISFGAFNHHMHNHIDYLVKSINKMYSLCNKGIILTLLSNHYKDKKSGLYYCDPGLWLNCCAKLSHKITLEHTTSHSFCLCVTKYVDGNF